MHVSLLVYPPYFPFFLFRMARGQFPFFFISKLCNKFCHKYFFSSRSLVKKSKPFWRRFQNRLGQNLLRRPYCSCLYSPIVIVCIILLVTHTTEQWMPIVQFKGNHFHLMRVEVCLHIARTVTNYLLAIYEHLLECPREALTSTPLSTFGTIWWSVIHELECAVIEVWDSEFQEFIQNLILSIPQRLLAVIRDEGDITLTPGTMVWGSVHQLHLPGSNKYMLYCYKINVVYCVERVFIIPRFYTGTHHIVLLQTMTTVK